MRRLTVATFLTVMLAAVLTVGGGAQQHYFRFQFNLDRSSPKHLALVGRVFNDSGVDAVNVRLKVVATDAAGNMVAERNAYVDRVVPARGEAYWDAKFPPNPAMVGFRIVVVGYEYKREGER
jgi:hypothetical protein